MASRGNKDKFRKALMASTDKYVKQQGRNTITENALRDAACVGYARIPSPDACEFCVTMGAHNDFYHTEESAGGGLGHGAEDDLYHPYCNCQIVEVFRRRGEHVMRDPETGEVKPYDGAELVRRYNEIGRPTFAKNRPAENERRRMRRRNGEVPNGKSKAQRANNVAGAKLSDAEFDAAMKSLADAQSVDELKAAAARIEASWKRNANGRNKAQWDEMSKFAKRRMGELKASVTGMKPNLNIEIDEYVPCLVRKSDGAVLPTYVAEVAGKDLKGYNKRTGWFVNWQKDMEIDAETGLPIRKYKLMVEGSDEIQGLIGIIEPVRENDSLYVSWAVANPKSQSKVVGKDNKEYIGIGGHLFAIACEKSQELGLGGEWFGFARNNELYEYYIEKVGMDDIGGRVVAMSREKAQEVLGIYNYEWAG